MAAFPLLRQPCALNVVGEGDKPIADVCAITPLLQSTSFSVPFLQGREGEEEEKTKGKEGRRELLLITPLETHLLPSILPSPLPLIQMLMGCEGMHHGADLLPSMLRLFLPITHLEMHTLDTHTHTHTLASWSSSCTWGSTSAAWVIIAHEKPRGVSDTQQRTKKRSFCKLPSTSTPQPHPPLSFPFHFLPIYLHHSFILCVQLLEMVLDLNIIDMLCSHSQSLHSIQNILEREGSWKRYHVILIGLELQDTPEVNCKHLIRTQTFGLLRVFLLSTTKSFRRSAVTHDLYLLVEASFVTLTAWCR